MSNERQLLMTVSDGLMGDWVVSGYFHCAFEAVNAFTRAFPDVPCDPIVSIGDVVICDTMDEDA